ncbi:MAG: hypothetical protein KA807_02170 [Prolixibacteraceae bacterium]|nr:hypothetical protein [Prolixibacteraceae bacterium]
MSKIEDQRILIFCNEKKNIKQTIIDAAFLALKLEKEVCFFACYNNEKGKEQLQKETSSYATILKKDIPQLPVSTLVLKGKLYKLVRELGEKYNTIMLCSGGEVSNSYLKAFYNSGFPFYFSREGRSIDKAFKRIIIPVDFRSGTKDSVLWGSYLGRFNGSEITLFKAKDNDNDLSEKVEDGIASALKLYNKFSFSYKVTESNVSSWKIHLKAMELSDEYDLLIFTGSFNVILPDWIMGPFEKRIVNKLKATPVLLINPQSEMYVICS